MSTTGFQRISRIGFVTAQTSLNAGQPNFALVHYVHILGAVAPDRILPGATFSLLPSLAFSYIGSVTVRHASSGRQQNFAAQYLYATGRPYRSTLGGRTV